MILRILIIGFALAVMLTVYLRSRPPQKKVRTIIQSHRDRTIIGDGAWMNHPPRSARVRDIEGSGF